MNASDHPASESSPPEREVLRRRAEQLAARPALPAGAADAVQALDFSLAAQRCLLEIAWVREVRALGELLPVPFAPEPLLGLVQLRGRLLPVLDLQALLGVAAARSAAPRRLLVLGRDAPVFGVAAAEVHGLRSVSPQLAVHRGAPLESVRPGLMRGITADGHLFLDGERLLELAGTPLRIPTSPASPGP